MKSRKKGAEKQVTEEDRLLHAARRGELQLVLRWIMSEKHASSEHLLKNVLKFRNLNEAQLLAVLRSDPDAAGRPNQVGQYPLHLLAIYTSWPSVTMIREVADAFPHAAQMPDNAGWLPLHYFCKNCIARGESEPRATPALLRCLRAVFPEAARISLPDEKSYGPRFPSTLFGRNTFKHRAQCEHVLDQEDDDLCIQIEKESRAARHSSMSALLKTANEAADRGDAHTVAACLTKVPEQGLFSGFSDVPDKESGRFILHRCLERCGQSVTNEILLSVLAASPIIAYMPDAMGALPLHVLLSACETNRLTAVMVKALVEAHPRSCEHIGPRGWTCLHFWANRDPHDKNSIAVLKELLSTHSGRKALRIPDAKGELPLHLFARTCCAFKFAKEEEEFHGGTFNDFADSDSDNDSIPETQEDVKRFTSTNENNSQTVDIKETVDDQGVWDTRQPLALARDLLEGYLDAWRIKNYDGTTPMDLAPVEVKELFHEYIHEHEVALARERTRRRDLLRQEKQNRPQTPPLPIVIDTGKDELLSEILSKKLDMSDINTKAVTKRKVQQELDERAHSLRDLILVDDSHQGGTLLHRLLRRPNHNVSSETLRLLLSVAPEACTVTDKSDWTCLHLLIKRACDDCAVGTAGNLKRLARASPRAALAVGGGPRRNWTPLHLFCTMLSRHNFQLPPPSGEAREIFDQRILALFKCSVHIGGTRVRRLKDARGKTAYDILPSADYYNIFRSLCYPPDDSVLEKEEFALRRQSQQQLNPEDCALMPDVVNPEPKQPRRTRKLTKHTLVQDAPCVSLDLPGYEIGQVSRPATPQVLESLPEVSVNTQRPTSERDTLHKARAREAERWLVDEVRRQLTVQCEQRKAEKAKQRAKLKACVQARRKKRRECRQLKENSSNTKLSMQTGRTSAVKETHN